MSTPALLWLAIATLSLILNAFDHGKPRTGKDSFWGALITLSVSCGLLYWGGFFASVPA